MENPFKIPEGGEIEEFGPHPTRHPFREYSHESLHMVVRFPNGYGASVVRFWGSYGSEAGLWELAVIKFSGIGKWGLDYSTPITNDVIGHQSTEEINDLLIRISRLKSSGGEK